MRGQLLSKVISQLRETAILLPYIRGPYVKLGPKPPCLFLAETLWWKGKDVPAMLFALFDCNLTGHLHGVQKKIARKDAPNEKYMQLWCKCELKYGILAN